MHNDLLQTVHTSGVKMAAGSTWMNDNHGQQNHPTPQTMKKKKTGGQHHQSPLMFGQKSGRF